MWFFFSFLFYPIMHWRPKDKLSQCWSAWQVEVIWIKLKCISFGAELCSNCQRSILNSCDDPKVSEDSKYVGMNHREMGITWWIRHLNFLLFFFSMLMMQPSKHHVWIFHWVCDRTFTLTLAQHTVCDNAVCSGKCL